MMTNLSKLSCVVVVAAATGLWSTPARGQVPTCAQAQAILSTNGVYSRAQIANAWPVMIKCGDPAPPTIILALRQANANSARDTLAIDAAWALADRRLVDSIIVLAKDPTQLIARRSKYLALLTRDVNPDVAFTLGPSGSVRLATMGDVTPVTGNQPIDQPARNRSSAAIAWMSANDSNGDIRRWAAAIAKQLTW
jgi:hypothetical protein